MWNKTRFCPIAGILLIATWATPSSAELLFHQGFETCWVPGQTKAQFLETIRASIDGTSSCIPQTSGNQSGFEYTVCGTANGCGTGVAGCPVSISAGTFTGSFQAGLFSGPGAAANVAVPIVITGIANCTVNLNNTILGFSLDYLMQTDGVDGVYSDDLMTPTVAINSYQLVDGNCGAAIFSLILGNIASAIPAAEASASAAIEPGLRVDTLDRAICPISIP